MWLAAVSVVVVVAAGDPDDGSSRAIEQALRTALGADASVELRSAAEPEAAAAIAASATTDTTTLVGVVAWSDRQRRVTIHFSNREGRATDREIRFDPYDAPAERGRTVGFALASMVPASAFDERAAPKTTAPAAAPLALAPTGSAPADPAAPNEAPPTLPRPNGMALDAAAVATTALEGFGGGLGGAFAFRLPLVGATGARVALGARTGEVGPAQATSRTLSGAVGLTWQPWLDARRRWAAGARIDALVLHQELTHLSDDDPSGVSLARFVPGADAALEGAFRFADRALVVVAVGSEVALGKTSVVVRGREVASLSPVRLFGEMGLRVSF
jgi:hypothetical protein